MDQNPNILEQAKFFRSAFKGRENVFAIRRKKGRKRGYIPAYQYDPYMLRLHKNISVSFQDYLDKSLLTMSDEQIMKHI